ncbi:hypothetical protein EHW97_12285 [Aeromicrobium camelliae]|uniref:Uncharacterized protein n=1 Tax=Aeromicrobium camelliae TaxID=1538144 RepID=A0A3N6WM05_9ACTN|nr:hypothetical protein [Aeromicrobium camelliae]RQN02805.1 hypothetical protein EHW97_12285 [Aeromicrobium camelliae]
MSSTGPATPRYVITMATLIFTIAFLAIGVPAGYALGWPWYVTVPVCLVAGIIVGAIAYRAWKSSQ